MGEFRPMVKMACGGSVSKAVAKAKMKSGGDVSHDDVKEDKKLIRKAVHLHDDQLHEGKKTDLSTLKKGGRCKKDGGTVRKYKCGGEVKKMAIGGLTDPATQTLVNADVLKRRKMAQMGAAPAGGLGATPPALAQTAAAPNTQPPGPIMKKGGKVK